MSYGKASYPYADVGSSEGEATCVPASPLSDRLRSIVVNAINAKGMAEAVEGRLFGYRPQLAGNAECNSGDVQSVDDLVSRLASLVASYDSTVNNIIDRL
jgi:hypothetical protein